MIAVLDIDSKWQPDREQEAMQTFNSNTNKPKIF